jgi:hypothetical protein
MASGKQSVVERPASRTKKLTQQLSDTGKQLNATNADFLRIDVETALTFTRLALGTDNPEKKERNCKNARKAYDTILSLRRSVTFTPRQETYMREMLNRLRDELKSLGEKL